MTAHLRWFVSAMVLVGAAAPAQAQGPEGSAAPARFHYDEATGKCLDADGREGYNPGTRETLVRTRHGECTNFSGRELNLTYLRLHRANLRGANFQGAAWYLGSIEDSDLTGANLSGTWGQMDYTGSRLRGATLTGADLTYSDLQHADLDGVDLRGARFSPRTRLPFDADEAQRRGMVFVLKP